MWLKIVDKIKMKKKKMGVQSLTLIIGVLVGFIAIGGLGDLTILQTKFSTLSQQTGYVSRAISDQGGITPAQIENYYGRYVTSQELYSNVQSAMNNSGISDENWEVRVGGQILTPATILPIYDYRERIPVSITINYDWPFSKRFIPGYSGEGSRTSQVEVVSTYKVRESDFQEGRFNP